MGAATTTVCEDALSTRYARVRAASERLCAPLSDADATVQSMPDASPAKWHLAHTTWFFETFILRDHVRGYRLFDDAFPFLFNSYYEAEGARQARDRRGLLTRPALDEILAYRRHVDAALLEAWPHLSPGVRMLVELGTHHEEQHQELLCTDILHLFSCNPLRPAYDAGGATEPTTQAPGWAAIQGGVASIGHDGLGFAFDCEGPRHEVLLRPFSIARALVSNADWSEFIDDGGYVTPSLWLSDGWAWVQREGVEAPLYWRRADSGWRQFGLSGERDWVPDEAVRHVSFYEADAYAAWAGARLPREEEWEVAATSCGDLEQLYGACWQWTGSAYLPFPGFRPAAGAVGEYNGKFMSGQFVLRGGSCVTPEGHSRPTYRNFFYPHQRWQFTGLRLAKDA